MEEYELTQMEKNQIAQKMQPRLAKMDLNKCNERINSIQNRLQRIQMPKIKARTEERLRLIQERKVELEK